MTIDREPVFSHGRDLITKLQPGPDTQPSETQSHETDDKPGDASTSKPKKQHGHGPARGGKNGTPGDPADGDGVGFADELADDTDVEAFVAARYSGRLPANPEPRRGPRAKRQPAFRGSTEEQHGRLDDGLADATDKEGGLVMTYKPARYEAIWLRSSLRSFYEQNLIVDVLAQVKGGKEANVYRCLAHPSTGLEFLAAKVYRPRKFRNLANDQMYREGRQILTALGRPAKANDSRILRALGKKTEFGVQVQHTSWLMHEYATLERLFEAGGAVPRPFAANENAIVMSYIGDESTAAPTLQGTRLGPREAGSLLREVLRNVELMLSFGLIHGDLSAYNILYWSKQVTLIDFPQVTYALANRGAREILGRDILRVCEYFARQGARADSAALLEDLWARYGRPAEDMLADLMPED